jgi:hypothetical protein
VERDHERAGAQWLANEKVRDAVAQMGATVRRVTLAEYLHPRSQRVKWPVFIVTGSSAAIGTISDDVHAVASRRLERWLEQEHPAPDAPYRAQVEVSVLLAHWPPLRQRNEGPNVGCCGNNSQETSLWCSVDKATPRFDLASSAIRCRFVDRFVRLKVLSRVQGPHPSSEHDPGRVKTPKGRRRVVF